MTYRTPAPKPKKRFCIHVWILTKNWGWFCTKCNSTPSDLELMLLDHGMLLRYKRVA